jgi:predicted DNA-binding protein (MmcQ/YjbR family)
VDIERLRAHCLTKNGAVEGYPFGPEYPVFKVAGKIFALILLDTNPPWLNLKCDPLHAEVLRAYYPAVRPGYHMNKRHWNTVVLDGSVPEDDLLSMVDDSYALVVAGLPQRLRRQLAP